MNKDLHVTEIGQGEPIVFVHGAFDPAEETFGEQKELADQYLGKPFNDRLRTFLASSSRI
jgi:hypothetical protein